MDYNPHKPMANETSLVQPVVHPDYTIYIVILLGVLLIIAAWFIARRMKKNRQVNPNQIPPDVLKEFNRAEELSAFYKGSKTPQEILWQVNEERKKLFTLEKDEYKDSPPVESEPPINVVAEDPFKTSQLKAKPKINLGNLFRKK